MGGEASVQIRRIYGEPDGVTVLWVSRHVPVQAQLVELEKRLGKVNVVQLSGTIPTADLVVEIARNLRAKYIVPVLPMTMIAKLAEMANSTGEFTVLYSRMVNIAMYDSIQEAEAKVAEAPDRRTIVTYGDGKHRVFEFVGFEKIKAVRLETEPW